MTYAHRNGETEPPAEDGFYWFKGTMYYLRYRRDGMRTYAEHGMVYAGVSGVHIFGGKRNIQLANCMGRWWGPFPYPEELRQENLAELYAPPELPAAGNP